MSSLKTKKVFDEEVVCTLGSGSNGKVYKVKRTKLYALKVMDFENGDNFREILFLATLDHRNIVKFVDYYITDKFNKSGERKRKLCILMELCEKGSLRKVIGEDNLFKNPERVKKLFYQICQGLEYIHNKKVIHRDLKPENILLTDTSGEECIKISDFGLSRYLECLGERVSTMCGTIDYMAPEIFQLDVGKKYNSTVDVYSLGVILFEMCYRKISGPEKSSKFTALKRSNTQFPDDFDKNSQYSTERAIISAALSHDPDERPDVSDIIEAINTEYYDTSMSIGPELTKYSQDPQQSFCKPPNKPSYKNDSV